MLQTRMYKPIQEVTIGNRMTLKIKDYLLTSTLKELVFANNYTCKLNILVCNGLWIYLPQIVPNSKCDFQLWRSINKVRWSHVVTKPKSQSLSITKAYFLLTLHIYVGQRFHIVSQELRLLEAPLFYSYTIWNMWPPWSLQKGRGELPSQTLAFFSMKWHVLLLATCWPEPVLWSHLPAGYLENCGGVHGYSVISKCLCYIERGADFYITGTLLCPAPLK